MATTLVSGMLNTLTIICCIYSIITNVHGASVQNDSKYWNISTHLFNATMSYNVTTDVTSDVTIEVTYYITTKTEVSAKSNENQDVAVYIVLIVVGVVIGCAIIIGVTYSQIKKGNNTLNKTNNTFGNVGTNINKPKSLDTENMDPDIKASNPNVNTSTRGAFDKTTLGSEPQLQHGKVTSKSVENGDFDDGDDGDDIEKLRQIEMTAKIVNTHQVPGKGDKVQGEDSYTNDDEIEAYNTTTNININNNNHDSYIGIGGDFDLKQHLLQNNFTEYSKLENAFQAKLITLEDILECDEKELKEQLMLYHISPIQRNRFVKAIKLLPQSKITSNINSNGSALISNNNSFVNDNYLNDLELEAEEVVIVMGKQEKNIKNDDEENNLLYDNEGQIEPGPGAELT